MYSVAEPAEHSYYFIACEIGLSSVVQSAGEKMVLCRARTEQSSPHGRVDLV